MNYRPQVHRPVRSIHAGFSLIELMVVIALILVLTTLYWNSAAGPGGERRKQACASNLQKIHLAMEIYARDNNGKFPQNSEAKTSEEALHVLVPLYTSDTSVFICPLSKDSALPSGESFRKRRISYSYYMGVVPGQQREPLMSDEQVDSKSKDRGDLIFSNTGKAPGNNHRSEGGNILFSDGSVEFSPAQSAFSLVVTQKNIVLLNPKS